MTVKKMIINELKLHNFGVYAGTNAFDFHSKKPIVLIGGKNGRGKTTFLEAVLIALYGSNSFAYAESGYKTYGQYLKSYVNYYDQTGLTYVELLMMLDTPGNNQQNLTEQIRIRREWDGNGIRTREKIIVEKNGVQDPFLTDNWAMFIENVLPSGLSRLFFFDGEKISEIASQDTNNELKDSIKSLLGINVLDTLENDLNKLISNTLKKASEKADSQELKKARKNKDIAEKTLEKIDFELADLQRKLDHNNKKHEEKEEEYIAKGGKVIEERQDLYQRRTNLIAQMDLDHSKMIESAFSELPLLMVRGLLANVRIQVEKERDARMGRLAWERIKDLYQAYPEHSPELDRFLQYIKGSDTGNETEFIFNFSEDGLYKVRDLLDIKLDERKRKVHQILNDYKLCEAKKTNIDQYLTVEIDEKAVARLYKEMKGLEQECTELEIKLSAKKKERQTANGVFLRAVSELNRQVDAEIKRIELNDDSERMLSYTRLSIDLLQKYRERLLESKVQILADSVTNCYKRLANKKKLISRVEVDPSTLGFKYIGEDSKVVPKDSLSAGEKQLMVISILWGLAICSKQKLPVIIDTPLSRLDKEHRKALITTYFPNASAQTIILSTDAEIGTDDYLMMQENVGDMFILRYNEERKCSTIEHGYFTKDKNDHKADKTFKSV